jgi:uncharacterized HAD superfamily protein
MVDFDGVLADLDTAMVVAVNEKFDTNYTTADAIDYNWWRREPTRFFQYFWKECYASLAWSLEKLHPEPGAIEALADLLTNTDGVAEDVRVVTARDDASTRIAAEWLAHHLPDTLKVVIASTKGYRKSQYCDYHRLNVVVEDAAHNLRPMNSFRQKLYLVEKPHNANELLARVTRVKSLAEAIADIGAQVVAA